MKSLGADPCPVQRCWEEGRQRKEGSRESAGSHCWNAGGHTLRPSLKPKSEAEFLPSCRLWRGEEQKAKKKGESYQIQKTPPLPQCEALNVYVSPGQDSVYKGTPSFEPSQINERFWILPFIGVKTKTSIQFMETTFVQGHSPCLFFLKTFYIQ